ncbi:hypothetical protein ABBQ38_007567 [Trebouxia sp. C0009 RCD-2024]
MSQKSSWLRHCGDCCGDYWFSCCQAFLWQSPQYHSPFCCVPPRAWSNRAFKPFKQLVAAALKRITQDKKLYEAHTQLGQEANDGLLTFWAFLDTSLKSSCDVPWMTSAFQALYCFLQQPEWIDLCLRGGPGGGIDMPPLCLHAAISCVKDQLTARLTAGACWAQLCHLAVRRQQQPDVPVHTPYCEQAASSECMAALVDVLAQGVKEASIRPLHHVVKQLLQKVHEATLYERLQQQLLNASAMLLHVLVNKAPCAVPVEGLARAAIDAVVVGVDKNFGSADKVTWFSDGFPPGYSPLGFIDFGSLQLQSMLLDATMKCLETPEDWQYLGSHALPICLPGWVAAVNHMFTSSGSSAGSKDLVQNSEHSRPFCAVLPYYRRMLPPHPPGLNYPQGAARALLQLLSMLLKSLEDDQTVYAEKKSAAQKALLDEFVLGLPEGHPHMKRQAQLIQDGQNLFTVYANKKKKTNQSIEAAVSAMEEMRKDPSWVVSLAKAADAGSLGSWCGVQRGPAQRLKLSLKDLSKTHALSAAMVSRIECCYCPQQILETEAAEEFAAQQAQHEEEAAAKEADKAAAKRAKKQRQKAKKQQDQQQLDEPSAQQQVEPTQTGDAHASGGVLQPVPQSPEDDEATAKQQQQQEQQQQDTPHAQQNEEPLPDDAQATGGSIQQQQRQALLQQQALTDMSEEGDKAAAKKAKKQRQKAEKQQQQQQQQQAEACARHHVEPVQFENRQATGGSLQQQQQQQGQEHLLGVSPERQHSERGMQQLLVASDAQRQHQQATPSTSGQAVLATPGHASTGQPLLSAEDMPVHAWPAQAHAQAAARPPLVPSGAPDQASMTASSDMPVQHVGFAAQLCPCEASRVNDTQQRAWSLQAGQADSADAWMLMNPWGEEHGLRRHAIPYLLCCPLTKELLKEPMIAADGYTYEKHAFQEWLKQHNNSPVTGKPLHDASMLPNFAIVALVESNLCLA